MNDRELLEMAAKAAGRCIVDWIGDGNWVSVAVLDDGSRWQPLHENQFTDCMGDALRLAVKLKLAIRPLEKCVFVESDPETLLGQSQFSELEMYGSDPNAATRRAIVRAAAEIGKAMP